MHLPDNTLLQGGKYRIVRFISAGGFGCTYEGEHVLLGKRNAIKEFFVKEICNRETQTSHVTAGTRSNVNLMAKLKKKFLEEAIALSKFHHENIVVVTDVFEENGTAYYVMEYIDGMSVHDILKQNGTIAEASAVDIIRKVASALKYVHERNRLHLDIKPGNIMVDKDGKVFLIDFGASKQYNDIDGENTSTLLGKTPGYAPIEQMGNNVQTFNPATDIYSLGATLYKMITGETPPEASLLVIDGSNLKPLPSSVSLPVRTAIEKSMEIKPQHRPQNIDEFLCLLNDAKTEETLLEDVSNEEDVLVIKDISAEEEVESEEEEVESEEEEVIEENVPNDEEVESEEVESEEEEVIEENIPNDEEVESEEEDSRNNEIAESNVVEKPIEESEQEESEEEQPKRSKILKELAIALLATPLVLLLGYCLHNNNQSTDSEEAETGEAVHSSARFINKSPVYDNDRKALGYDDIELSYQMVLVEGGEFIMGATSEPGNNAYSDEKPSHKVTLSSFYIGQTEVPQWLWQSVMGENPSTWKSPGHPVESVTWNECQEFINKLNSITGKKFSLPTEAQWEYAARGGKENSKYKFSGSNNLEDCGWYAKNGDGKTHETATKQPNSLNLYDMSGNVSEWCYDRYDEYNAYNQTNPTGPETGGFRVFRGGSWYVDARDCRVSCRGNRIPSSGTSSIGLRLCLNE